MFRNVIGVKEWMMLVRKRVEEHSTTEWAKEVRVMKSMKLWRWRWGLDWSRWLGSGVKERGWRWCGGVKQGSWWRRNWRRRGSMGWKSLVRDVWSVESRSWRRWSMCVWNGVDTGNSARVSLLFWKECWKREEDDWLIIAGNGVQMRCWIVCWRKDGGGVQRGVPGLEWTVYCKILTQGSIV